MTRVVFYAIFVYTSLILTPSPITFNSAPTTALPKHLLWLELENIVRAIRLTQAADR
jgi:hypothetical protein